MTKKFKWLAALLVLVALLAAACGSDDDDDVATGDEPAEEPAEEPMDEGVDVNVGLVYDIGGRGDQSFNDAAAAGLDASGATGSESVPNEDGSNRAELLQLQAESNELVLGIGFLFADDINNVAKDNPDINFGVVDGVPTEDISGPPADNLAMLLFAEEQGSFLVGAAAALKSESGHIGFIGGVNIELIQKFEAGYVAGATAVNPDIVIDIEYITEPPDFDGFNAPDRAREIGNAMYAGGADVIYAAAGGSGGGLFEAAAATSESSGVKVWAIGVDSDQYNLVSPDVQEYILTSMIKRVDVAVESTIRAQADGSFAGGFQIFDLSVDGVGYSTSGGFIDDITDQLEDYKAQIIDGTIEVPAVPS